jgi:hypothetical protein
MKHHGLLLSRLTGELVAWCLTGGATDVDATIRRLPKAWEIFVSAVFPEGSRPAVERLSRLLSSPRSAGTDEYYWNLYGSDDAVFQLGLVGAMTDEADVRFDDETGRLTIRLLRAD